MGPRSRERGNNARAWYRCATCQASMGPRSRERGNFHALDHRAELLQLQWGRAHVSAEILDSPSAIRATKRFNGAALT